MGSLDTPPTQSARTRLHITPFNPDLYRRIIPPSLQPLASDTSFHTLQTFPDRGFGFVELPTMDAHNLRKKLHGSTLKGTKMSVEEARPVKKRKSDADADVEERARKRERRERRQHEDDVLAGHELEEGRRVKRGWTGDDSRGAKGRSKTKDRKEKAVNGSEERKLRFKTKVPPNKSEADGKREKKKDKKDKKAKGKGQVVVEEFTKRRKSRTGDGVLTGAPPGSRTYEEGKGWVDEAGDIVEPERRSSRRKKQPTPDPAPLPGNVPDEATVGAEEEEETAQSEQAQDTENPPSHADSPPSDSDSEAPPPADDSTSREAKEVHPLEALFRRPAPASTEPSPNTTPTRPRPAPIDTSFSFFGAGDADAEEDTEIGGTAVAAGSVPPATPHTKQDLEWRSLRSAAPTPDTAAIGRKFSFPFAGEEEDEEEEKDEEEEDGMGESFNDAKEVDGGGEDVAGRGEESAFRKWFFENRGDLNRGWKKRRREERKVKRQRENRRLGRKVA